MSPADFPVRFNEALCVHKGDDPVGELCRTPSGARFAYSPAYAALGDAPGRRIALRMPVRAEPYEVRGVNLHPYFAGLLPEGLRLAALVRRAKTSSDDLFTLLAASGGDAIGDVWVTPLAGEAEPPAPEPIPRLDPRALSRSTFAELLADHLRLGEPVAVPGVMPKLSAARITVPVRAPAGARQYLLKLAPPDHPRLVDNEAFFMALARAVGIDTAKVRLVHDAAGEAGLLVERFDRRPRPSSPAGGATPSPFERLHLEDALQFLDRYPADKYRLAIREVMESLEHASAPPVERLRLLERLAFAYLIADGDLHGKNISLLTCDSLTRLSPAYDVLSTLPYGDDRQALEVEGRDQDLARAHFLALGERHGLRPAAIERVLDRLLERLPRHLPRLAEIGLPERQSRRLQRTIEERLRHLGRART